MRANGVSGEGLIQAADAGQAAWMDSRTCLAFVLMLLSGCSAAAPSNEGIPGTLIVGRIERLLAGRPCIGALEGWERHYSFGHRADSGLVDRNVIEFSFLEAGIDGFRAQRRLDRIDDGFIYDGLARVALGEYHVASGRLFVHFCGRNGEPALQPMFESFNRAADDLR